MDSPNHTDCTGGTSNDLPTTDCTDTNLTIDGGSHINPISVDDTDIPTTDQASTNETIVTGETATLSNDPTTAHAIIESGTSVTGTDTFVHRLIKIIFQLIIPEVIICFLFGGLSGVLAGLYACHINISDLTKTSADEFTSFCTGSMINYIIRTVTPKLNDKPHNA